MLGFGNPRSIEAWGRSCHTGMIDYCTSKVTYSDKIVFQYHVQMSEKNAEFIFDNGILEIDLLDSKISRSIKDNKNFSKYYEKKVTCWKSTYFSSKL